jgi:hypothetical protein
MSDIFGIAIWSNVGKIAGAGELHFETSPNCFGAHYDD